MHVTGAGCRKFYLLCQHYAQCHYAPNYASIISSSLVPSNHAQTLIGKILIITNLNNFAFGFVEALKRKILIHCHSLYSLSNFSTTVRYLCTYTSLVQCIEKLTKYSHIFTKGRHAKCYEADEVFICTRLIKLVSKYPAYPVWFIFDWYF